MARQERLVNNASTTLNAGINAAVTSLVVDLATSFPTEGDFRIIIDSEILLVTAVSGTTFTVVRGADSSSAASHSLGATVTAIVTKGSITQFLRDKDPWANLRPPFRIVDTNGAALTSTDFTWVNQGTATVSDDDGNITITKDDSATTDNTCLVRSLPSTPLVITMCIGWEVFTDNVSGGTLVGAVFRESGTGKLVVNSVQVDLVTPSRVIYHSSPTTAGVTLANRRPHITKNPIWFRMEDDGTTTNYLISTDGFNYILAKTELRGTNFTTGPDEVGFFMNNDDGVDDNKVSLLAYDGE